jgi:hypothetical protein
MDMVLQYGFSHWWMGPNHRHTLSLSTQCPTIRVSITSTNYFQFLLFLPNTLLFCVPNVEKLLLLNPN